MLSGGDYTAEAEAGVGAADRRAAWPRPWAEWDDGHPPAAAAGVAAGPREARRTAAEVCSSRRSGACDSCDREVVQNQGVIWDCHTSKRYW